MNINIHKYSNDCLNMAMQLVKEINGFGYEAYAVGGCVRDLIQYELGQAVTTNLHDVDIATNMPIEELQKHFKTRSNNGEAHGTILVLYGDELYGFPYEVTQFRTDGDYSDGRHPDSVTFAKTFKEDASRRDLTINALGLGADGNVIDYFGGVDDIKNKIIRTVGNANDRFSEDALRIIRALRFAVVFDYKIDDETSRAMGDEAYRVKKLSAERIRKEFVTVAEKGNFATFVHLMEMNHVLPYVSALGLITPSILTDSLPKLYRYNKDTGVSASVNKDNLVPLLAIKSFDPEETLKRLCATRDEARLYKYYRYFMDYLETIEPYGWTWTKLVEFVEGDYKNVLWYGVPFHFSDDFYQQLEIAKFLSQNKPDFKKISERLKESGVKEGSEFGEKYREMVEAEYTKKANMLTKELITTIGRSTVHYKLHYVD